MYLHSESSLLAGEGFQPAHSLHPAPLGPFVQGCSVVRRLPRPPSLHSPSTFLACAVITVSEWTLIGTFSLVHFPNWPSWHLAAEQFVLNCRTLSQLPPKHSQKLKCILGLRPSLLFSCRLHPPHPTAQHTPFLFSFSSESYSPQDLAGPRSFSWIYQLSSYFY